MTAIAQLRVKIFADGANKSGMLDMYCRPYIKGFTTNPTLMHKAGITDYRAFARDVLESIPDRPISFEVFADDESEMERQAREMRPGATRCTSDPDHQHGRRIEPQPDPPPGV